MLHLPVEQEIYKLPKQWIVNVCYKIIGDRFEKWIMLKIHERNDKLAETKNLMISIDPEIAKIFNSSNFVSCK